MKYNARNEYTQRIVERLQEQLAETPQYLGEDACVYATGSFGRGEASPNSDCDLFIGAKASDPESDEKLSRLNEICVKANLVRAVRELNLPDFDRDGAYLRQHSVYDFKKIWVKPTTIRKIQSPHVFCCCLRVVQYLEKMFTTKFWIRLLTSIGEITTIIKRTLNPCFW